MTSRNAFKVTEKAGDFVAGMRNPGRGETIELTDEQAYWPLHAGEIEPADGKAPKRKAAKEPVSGSQGGDPVTDV